MLPVTYPRDVELVEGRLLRRYKRFLADVELAGGDTVTAHCVNTGRMEGLTEPGLRVWISRATNPRRKLKWTWELVEVDGCVIGADTSLPNRLVERLLREERLTWLPKYDEVERERALGDRSRVDFRLSSPDKRWRLTTYLEVKNCHLKYPDDRAYFPDAVSRRATHHLRALAEVQDDETRAHVLFTCQVPGARTLRPSDLHDPEFASTARVVRQEGVKFSAVEVVHTTEAITVTRRLPVDLRPYAVERVERFRD